MDVRLSDLHYYFVYDPILYGYSTQFWKDISGAATVSSNKIRVNTTTIASKEQYQRGDFTFRLTAPIAPTAGDDRKVGLVSPAQGLTKNALFFKWNGSTFTAEVVNSAGTATSTPITWLAAWTATATNFQITWLQRSVVFTIGGNKVAEVADQDLLPDRSALSAYILNVNADNLDLTYFQIAAAEKFVPNKEINVTASLSASDIEIGAVEIKNGTDDTRMTVATDDSNMPATPNIMPTGGEYRATPTTYTDGDAAVLQQDINGYLKVNVAAGGGMTDDAAFTVGTTSITPVAGTYKSVRDSVDDNDAGALAMTAKRGLYVSPETPNGDSMADDTYDAMKIMPSTYATDDSAMPATPVTMPVSGEYRAAQTAYTDGDVAVVQQDQYGNLRATLATAIAGEDLTANVLGVNQKPVAGSTYSPSTPYKDAGSVTKANVKASAGNIYSVRFTNANAAIRYLQIHNKATAPAAAETAARFFLIPAGTATQPAVLELDSTYFAPSSYHGTGLGWAVSTTATTFTDSATAADHTIEINYV